MSLADDHLALAKRMVNYKKNDLLDARLRRAISTAYYALFHLLLERGAAKLVAHPQAGYLVGRAYSHSDMYKAAKSFQSGPTGLPAHLSALLSSAGVDLPPEIPRVATVFVTLQEARHEADYDRSKTFTRVIAQTLVTRADQAFTDWNRVSATPIHTHVCELFLAALLLGERWKK